eukprot:1760771-Rhodomonas_salina.6
MFPNAPMNCAAPTSWYTLAPGAGAVDPATDPATAPATAPPTEPATTAAVTAETEPASALSSALLQVAAHATAPASTSREALALRHSDSESARERGRRGSSVGLGADPASEGVGACGGTCRNGGEGAEAHRVPGHLRSAGEPQTGSSSACPRPSHTTSPPLTTHEPPRSDGARGV